MAVSFVAAIASTSSSLFPKREMAFLSPCFPSQNTMQKCRGRSSKAAPAVFAVMTPPQPRQRPPSTTGSVKRAMTLTEKILARASEQERLEPGKNVWVNVDVVMTNDICGPGTFGIFKREFGEDAKVWDREKIVVIPDHYIFTSDERANRNVGILRDFCNEQNIKYFYDITDLSNFKANPDYKGVCHIALAQEGHCRPGEILTHALLEHLVNLQPELGSRMQVLSWEQGSFCLSFIDEYIFDVSKLEPLVAKPHSPDNRALARECKGVKIDRVYIGSCTGGKTEDFVAAAKVFLASGERVKVPTFVVPATQKVWMDLYALTIPGSGGKTCSQIFEEAGCDTPASPSCGACMGGPQDTYARMNEPQVCVSTTNRNFPGRMGHKEGQIYLASPYTAAASALTGFVTDPREFLQ